MDSESNNQDNSSSADALKDLTAELENLKAEDLAAETPVEASPEPSTETPVDASPETSPEASLETPSEATSEASPEVPSEAPVETPIAPTTPVFDPSTLEQTGFSSPASEEPAAESTLESAAETENSSTDFSETGSAESQPESEEKEAPKEPIKPAAPVPGSIGSAKSYEDYQTDEANRVNREADLAAKEANRAAKEASAKKTTSTALILGIVIAAILIIAATIFALVTISNKPKNNSAVTPQPEVTPTPEPVFSSITCTKSLTGAELTALGEDAVEASMIFTATYYDDELNDISDKTIIEYKDETAAKASVTELKDAYESTLALLGITSDPFNSTYPVVDSTLTITHLADSEDITDKNFAMFGLRVDTEGKVQTDIMAIEELYTEKDFTCVIK